MRQTFGIRIPVSQENAKKHVCWNCPVPVRGKCAVECAHKSADLSANAAFDPEKVSQTLYRRATGDSDDTDGDRSCLWELVQFLVATV